MFFITIYLLILSQSFAQEGNAGFSTFIKGADVSALKQVEENGGLFTENGIQKNSLQILNGHGFNFIRLRIWHSPPQGNNNLEKTLSMAQRIKSLGMKFLLDIHYSDSWADPGQQNKPAAWLGLSFQQLKDSVYFYSRNLITAFKNQNTLPDIVQIGNEIICGMLWNDGCVCGQFNTTQQWEQFAELLHEGIRGVTESVNMEDTVKIMIHIDRGGDNAGSRWFFDNLNVQNVSFDIIGLSFYPWWHGTLADLQFNLTDLSQRYGKKIIVVETAYPWTLAWNDNTNNIVGNSGQLLTGYPATVEGQKNFLADEINVIQNIQGNNGLGMFYWEPDWISAPTFGSSWENLALFDFDGELLNSISVFDSTLTNISQSNELQTSFVLFQNYPNPFNPVTKIRYAIPTSPLNLSPYRGEKNRQRFVTLKVYDILGNEVAILVDEYKAPGDYEVEINSSSFKKFSSGVYFYQLRAGDFSQTKKMVLLR